MFSKDFTYFDFNGKQHTEKLYFNIMIHEMADLQFNPMVEGDLAKFVQEGVKSDDGRRLWITFKLLVVNSYGRRSEDGSEFFKNGEWTEQFLNSRLCEVFFEWLLLDSPDGKHAVEFYNAIMPERLKNAQDAIEESASSGKKKLTELSREELQQLYLEATSKPKAVEA